LIEKYCRDRASGTGGGVLITTKSELNIQRERKVELDDLEIVAVSGEVVNGKRRKQLSTAVCYRPPPSKNNWTQSFDDFLNKIHTNLYHQINYPGHPL
jgi:hypothetical protein